MHKLLVILGPTATGKTDIALTLAKKFNGELVACDSRQVYRGLDVGTGKFPGVEARVKKNKGNWAIDDVNVWMYDVVSLKKQYTVADYIKDATLIIDDISKRGKLPIVVGGTGLYLRGLMDGLSNLSIPVDKKLRKELSGLGLVELQEKLEHLSPASWKKLNDSDKQNKRRLLRSIELLYMNPRSTSSGLAYTDTSKKWIGLDKSYDVLKVGITGPRPVLYQNINSRVFIWIKDGILDEAKKLIKSGISKKRFKEIGLEYGVIVDYLDNKVTKEELTQKMQTVTRQYAKRQITWFKKEKNVNWFDITENYLPGMEKLILKWYHPLDG